MKKLCLIMFAAWLGAQPAPLAAVELTVTEPSGLDRVDEPVTCGVPLPEGYAASADELILLAGSGQLPVEIREVSRWGDGSLSWVHLDFKISVPASESKRLKLEKGTRENFETKLEINDLGEVLEVKTGRIQARVRKAGFNVLDMVRVANESGEYESTLIPHHGGGVVAWQDSVAYRSSYDEDSELVVECSGPMRAVLRSTGRLTTREGGELLNYVCRLYFYNDSPVVRMALSVENRDQVIRNKVELQGLHVEIPTLLRGNGMAFDIGMMTKDFQGIYGQSSALAFSQINDSEQAYVGSEMHWEQDESPKVAKSDRVGWGALGAGAG
ncbi:MAG: hypothetical protein FVQ81_08275, partial [Candidatus Glassbacteria bacterium]|nr:hypothetical protein [Candidatus Glassbacteria bacterium]